MDFATVAKFNQIKAISISPEKGNRNLYENNKINNTGEWLFTLKAVHKIGSTILDKSYREFTFKKLSKSVVLEKVVQDGMGGLENFVSQYNPNLILGTWSTAEDVAKALGLKDMKSYTRPTSSNDSTKPNYLYERITSKGAIKVKASEFESWISKQNQKINVESEGLNVSLLISDRNGKTFNINGNSIYVAHKGTWFFTNEAFVVTAFISQMPAADKIADQFLQYTKQGEIQTKNAKVLSNIVEKAIDSGVDFSKFLDREEYLELLTNNDKQDLMISEAAKVVQDGMGGLENFVRQYNPNLILGTWSTAEDVAKALGLKNLYMYTMEDDKHTGKSNYKYERITNKGALKVKASEAETWLIKQNDKFNSFGVAKTVELLISDKTGKTFNVNGKSVYVDEFDNNDLEDE